MNYPCAIVRLVRLDGRSGPDMWRLIFNASDIHVTPHGSFHKLGEVVRFFRCATLVAANKELDAWLMNEGANG